MLQKKCTFAKFQEYGMRNMCSIIVSVYNEEDVLPLFYEELCISLQPLECESELIFVNDGSIDNSLHILKGLGEKDSRVRIINFSRNFGHEAAMIAGLDHCKGDFAVCLDADLQHPPQYINEMYAAFTQGTDIVNMVRKDRKDGGWLRRITSSMFYALINKITKTKLEPNASDFFMVSRRVIDLLKTEYRERNRFLRGFIQMIGFNRISLEFTAPKRAAGESKYSTLSLVMLSFSAMTTLSKAPLKLGLWCGLTFGLFGLIVAIYSLVQWIIGEPISGYTTTIITISAMFCVNFIVLGIMGEYIATLFDETKKRPNYIVMDIIENTEGDI